MKRYQIEALAIEGKNKGICREWAVCSHYMVPRTSHDHTPYDKGSDLDIADKHISIKASRFTLMSGRLCEGHEDFDGIWSLYAERVHSNCFIYVTADFVAYEMNLDEFKKFVYTFGILSRDSKKNGGKVKIAGRPESGKMRKWLAAQAAA